VSAGDQQPKTTFFFDACVSPKVVEILNLVQKDDVIVHMFNVEGFGRDDVDIVWIPKVAALGHVLVTSDNAQRRRVVERVLREEVKIRTVFLPPGFSDLDRWGHAKWIINHWQGIANHTRRCREGETFLVKMGGGVEKHVPKKK
jgi:hypothetical protein